MKRTVKERRKRNRELAEMDKRNRCPICKIRLGPCTWGSVRGENVVDYCSQECRDTAVEREAEASR